MIVLSSKRAGTPARISSHEENQGTQNSQQVTILVVEDEPEILAPLVHSLKQEGYRVLEAEDGLAACRLIGTDEPDLILLDIMLPDLDGGEVCRMLRQHPVQRIATTPVIMLTAMNAQQDKIRGLALGADIYMSKPYSLRELLLYAANLVLRRQRARKIEEHLEQLTCQEFERANFNHLLFHELRNRLFVLDGYTELLNSGLNTDGCVEAISRNSAYLNNLAEDILLIRKVQDGHFILHRAELQLDEIFEDIRQLYAAQAREKGATLHIIVEQRRDEALRLNRPALKIILSTLLDNALKYGPSGKNIVISAHHTSDRLEILVIDEGTGISAEEIEKVFEPFYRGAETDSKNRGSGMGLHGVRVLSRSMGGDVMIEQTPGKRGCCFKVILPLTLNASKSGEPLA